jgi:serine/threonine-protein kinase RsbW
VPAVATSVSELRATVAQLLRQRRWPQTAVENVSLAVSEASTNVVLHAYDEDMQVDPVIRLRVTEHRGRAEVWVEDAGGGMPRKGRSSSSRMGLGLPLIGAVSVGFEVDVSDDLGGCRVRMQFVR